MATITDNFKLIAAKWAILSLLLIYVSPYLSNWMNGYINFLGTVGSHVTRFLAYLIFLWLGNFILNKALGVQ